MIKSLLKTTILLLILSVSAQNGVASHIMGLDLTYECLGPNEYEFTLNFYRDCSGVDAPTSAFISIESASCGEFLSESLTQDVANSGIEVSQLCPGNTSTCDDPNAIYPGVEVYTYTGVVTLPAECDDWIISYSDCCRNPIITNINAPDNYGLYVEALLNNADGLCNSSPVFTSLPVPYFCTDQNNFYNHSTINADGNTLVYSLIEPFDQGAIPITDYTGGLSGTLPITTDPGNFNFDAGTGQLLFNPIQQEICILAVLVEEFDAAGNLIGSVMRDIQVVIVDCVNEQSYLDGGIQNLDTTVAILTDSLSIEVCPGAFIEFDIVAADNNPMDTLFLNSNIATAIPAATLVVDNSSVNPISANFQWQPTVDDVGFNTFSLVIQDNSCPIPSNQIYGIYINVLAGTSAGPDQFYCPSGGATTIVATGGTLFNWTTDQTNPGIIYESPNGDTLIVEPAQDTEFYLSSNLGNNCISMDTMTVFNVPDFDYELASDTNICLFQTVQLETNLDPGSGPYTYTWEPDIWLNDPLSASPISEPYDSVSYIITMTSDAGCTVIDSTVINVSGVAPVLDISPTDTTVCAGDPVQFESLTDCFPCEIFEGTATTTVTPFAGFYEDGKMQMLFRQDELINLGLTGGPISEIAFNVLNIFSAGNYDEFTISMGLTAVTDLNNAAWETGLTPVYGPQDHLVAVGWNTFVLDFPFFYDGSSNLIIETCFNNPGPWTQDDEVSANVTAFNSCHINQQDGAAGCTIGPGFSVQTERPDIRFTASNDQIINNSIISWSPANTLDDATIPDPTATPLTTTTYELTVDYNGCLAIDTVTVYVPDDDSINAREDTIICEDFAVQLFIEGSIAPGSTYSWSPAATLDDPTAPNPIASPNVTTEYVVTISNSAGCDITDTVTVFYGENLDILTSESDTICFGSSSSLFASGGDTYLWSGDNLSCDDCPNPIATPAVTTTYDIHVENSTGGCPVDEQITVIVNPNPDIEAGDDITLFNGESAQIEAVGAYTSISWSPPDGLDDPTASDPVTSIAQNITYIADVENEFGCKTSDTLDVVYLGCKGIYIPTAFSPNGDGMNDGFRLIEAGFDLFISLQVYNRWGEMVFFTLDENQAWDGIYNGELAPVGSYAYILTGLCDDEQVIKTGNVTLIK